MARVRTGLGVLWDCPAWSFLTAVRGFFVFLGHDLTMNESVNADDRVAHDYLERIEIFKELADEYAELLEEFGEVEHVYFAHERTVRDRMGVYLRIMLERKFLVKENQNTYIPNVIIALRDYLKSSDSVFLLDHCEQIFADTVSGKIVRTEGNFNGVDVDLMSTREMTAYGRLLHSDRNKFIKSRIINDMSMTLMIEQSRFISTLIDRLRWMIASGIESGEIPESSDTIRATWLDMNERPELYKFSVDVSR